MASTRIRPGHNDDTDWLYRLFRQTNRDFIETTWGWDELLQREAFFTNLPGNQFRILELDGDPAGGYHLARKSDPHQLWLEMILVKPDLQRRGYGTLMMQHIKDQARVLKLPVRLKVLRSNPALLFYRQQQFTSVQADVNSLKMEWPGDAWKSSE